MGSYALALVLLSALLHASWNALLKREQDIETATVAVLAVAAASSLATALFTSGAAFPDPHGLGWALSAGVFEGGYFIALAMALLHAPLGFAYAVARGGAIALVWPISVLFLGEALTPCAIAGVLLLWAGLLSVGLGGDARAFAVALPLNLLALAGAGVVLTLRNISVVFAQVFAFALGERLPRRQVIGALLIALGAGLIGWPR